MWVRGAIAALALLASPAQPVQAERAKGVAESPGARVAIDEARQSCRKARGLRLKVGAEAIRTIDLNGDGRPDTVVDWMYRTCERSPHIFCGTGGCPVSIVVALPNGKHRKLFGQQVIRYAIEPGEGARIIRFGLHGTYCNGAGADPCSKRVTIGEKPFSFKQPL